MSDDLLAAAAGRPRCVALVICSEILEDKETNNKSLIGLFNNISVLGLPSAHPSICLLLSLAEGRGTWNVQFVITAPSGSEVCQLNGTETFANEQEVHDVAIKLRGFPITEVGIYRIDALVGETLISTRHFNVSQIQAQEGP